MKYKAVIADVDGTLIAPSEAPAQVPSKRVIEKVLEAQRKGVVFTIASGRSLPWVGNLIKSFKLTAPIILDNGARIYDTTKKEYIWQSLLSKEDAQKIIKILDQDKTIRVFITDDDNRLDSPRKISKWKISKILVLGVTPEKAEDLYQKLRVIPTVHVTKSISGGGKLNQSIHVTNHNATKQVAVVKLSKFLKISTKEMIGIGDSYNDFPLLLACGLKVAMRNAVPEIKEIADYIAPSYEDDGVADVLEKFILR